MSFRRAWITVFLAFVAVGTFWNLAQPLLSGADEGEHYISGEAVYSGQILPPLARRSTTQFEPGVVTVPIRPNFEVQDCFVAKPDVSAACVPTRAGPLGAGQIIDYTSREPPLPAFVNGLPIHLLSYRLGFYLGRFLDTVVGAGFLATAAALAMSRARPLLAVGVVLAATPSVVAGFGVLGSSQLEIGAATVVWVTTALVVTGEAATRRLVVVLTLGSIVLLGSRPISFVYLALAGLTLVVAARRGQLRALLAAPLARGGMIAVLAVFAGALAWYRFASAPANPSYLAVNHLPVVRGVSARLSLLMAQTPGNWIQAVGAVGFNEYNGPWYMTLLWTAMISAVVAAGLLFAHRRLVVVVGGLVVVLLALPLVTQGLTLPSTYLYWQGRYDLPTIAGIVVLAAASADLHLGNVPQLRRLATGPIVVAGLLQMVEFFAVLHRYAVGVDGTLDPLGWRHGWHPPLPVVVLLVSGLAAIAACYLLVLRLQQSVLGPGGGPRPPAAPADSAVANQPRGPR